MDAAVMWDGILAGATQVMLGVDRLDMIKGIPQKLLAFEKFLEENQHWRDKVLLVQIAVPTRTDVSECTPLSLDATLVGGGSFLILLSGWVSRVQING